MIQDCTSTIKSRLRMCAVKQVHVAQPEAIQELVTHASKARSTGSTGVNDESSRSHSIMQFALKRESESDGHPVGKISFIDLAGSERGADTYDNNRYSHAIFGIFTSCDFLVVSRHSGEHSTVDSRAALS